MEFIKIRGGKYLVKNSNGKIVNEKEKRDIEAGILSLKSAACKECHTENKKPITTSKKENKKKKPIVEKSAEEVVEVLIDESVKETDFII